MTTTRCKIKFPVTLGKWKGKVRCNLRGEHEVHTGWVRNAIVEKHKNQRFYYRYEDDGNGNQIRKKIRAADLV